MFRKIHSNRDPRDTLFSELGKVFGQYFSRGSAWFKEISGKYPNQTYTLMVVVMLISLLFSFSIGSPVNRQGGLTGLDKVVSPARDGFGNILETGAVLKQTLELKGEIQGIIAKDSLSASDSLRLEKALDRLHQINQSLEK